MEAPAILGEWKVRRGDRLPMLALVVETDAGVPVNLTGATVIIQFRPEDGSYALDLPTAPQPALGTWYERQALIVDPVAGLIVYDFLQEEVDNLTIATHEVVVRAEWPDNILTAPSARDARLVVRSALV